MWLCNVHMSTHVDRESTELADLICITEKFPFDS